MGVTGLLSFCQERRDQCAEYVDLVEVARQRHGIQILVDFYAFEHLILKNLKKSLCTITQNENLRIFQGEYLALDGFITKLVKDLKSLEIDLVMFVDGSKGSSRIGTEQKLSTWKHRHFSDVKKLRDLMDVCQRAKRLSEVPEDVSVRPVLLEVQMFESLRKCGCEVVQCVSGEADFVLARNLQLRPKAYAILSNDSDFCVFKDCAFIPMELFDLNKDLKFGAPQPIPEKPVRLSVGLIYSNRVAAALELDEPSQLIDVSILSGNDFTSPYVRGKFKERVGLAGRVLITDVANWVKCHKRVENFPFITKEMQHNPQFHEAVIHSRQFYDLTLPDQEPPLTDPVAQTLADGISHGHYPGTLMGMHNSFYWHRMLLEDTTYNHPCVEMALSTLRSAIYRMLLPHRENVVMEYGRTPWQEFNTTRVYASGNRSIQGVNSIHSNQIFRNLKTFNYIMMHQEPYFHVRFIERYGRKNGFTCILLRYFLKLNMGQNLYVTMEEFLALVAMVFSKVDHAWYASLRMLPSARCVTMGNWFQDIYRHAYQFLGKILFLTHEFPEPKEIFSGAVWTAFYTANVEEGMLVSAQFPRPWLHRIHCEKDDVIKEKRHMLRYITEELLDYQSRW